MNDSKVILSNKCIASKIIIDYDGRMLFVLAGILIILLASLAYVDIKEFRLPNILTYPLMFFGLVQAYFYRGDITSGLVGLLVGYVTFVIVEIAYKKLSGKDGLGRGDAKLLAAGGAWVGWMGLSFIILIASATALVSLILPSLRHRFNQGFIPFGPYLAFAIIIVWFSQILASY